MSDLVNRISKVVMELGHKLCCLGDTVVFFGNRMSWYSNKLEKRKK